LSVRPDPDKKNQGAQALSVSLLSEKIVVAKKKLNFSKKKEHLKRYEHHTEIHVSLLM